MIKILYTLMIFFVLPIHAFGQWNFDFYYSDHGKRVALISATATTSPAEIKINFLDFGSNNSDDFSVYRRALGGTGDDWVLQVNLSAGTESWTDTAVEIGEIWEYKVRRTNATGFAVGYLSAGIEYDQTGYRGQMILLLDNSIESSLTTEIHQLKQDLTGAGWFVETLSVNRVSGWDGGSAVVDVKQQIQNMWNSAPADDKPSHLFILGHIPVPRAGLGADAPDGHPENKGSHGADSYYADLDGVFTDTETFTAEYLLDPNSENQPGDFRWDQDFIPSSLELAYGRIDFADLALNFPDETEIELLRRYLNKLHQYKIVAQGFDFGQNSGFQYGYENSVDGSIRSMVALSGVENVYQYAGPDNYSKWVKNNGPFLSFWQNSDVPSISDWEQDGMDAVLFSSDQSYWGWWAKPENTQDDFEVSPRSLLASDTKCLSVIWATTAVNLFHETGIGETLGSAVKRVIDHNAANQIFEKPSQFGDESAVWNRTHMALHGDPTLELLQVIPATQFTGEHEGNAFIMNWTASVDENIVGYHVYRSETEFGHYMRLSENPELETFFIDTVNEGNVYWYMVRAVKRETTGSGTFLNAGQGVFLQSPIKTGLQDDNPSAITLQIYPNPASDWLRINTVAVGFVQFDIFDLAGRQVISVNKPSVKEIDVSTLPNGIYIYKISAGGSQQTGKVVIIH